MARRSAVVVVGLVRTIRGRWRGDSCLLQAYQRSLTVGDLTTCIRQSVGESEHLRDVIITSRHHHIRNLTEKK